MTNLVAVSAFLVGLANISAVAAQDDELIGTWALLPAPDEVLEDEGVTIHLTLKADETFETLFIGEILPPDDEVLVIGDFDIENGELPDIPRFPKGIGLKVVLRGSWEAEDGVLTLRFEESEITYRGLTAEEFYVAAARDFAAVLAEEAGITDEEYGEFEAAVVALFLSDTAEDREFLEGFFVGSVGEEEISDYEVDGDSLVFFVDGEVDEEFRRVSPSVISASSWGQVKSASTTP